MAGRKSITEELAELRARMEALEQARDNAVLAATEEANRSYAIWRDADELSHRLAEETGLTVDAVTRDCGERLLRYIRDLKARTSAAPVTSDENLSIDEINRRKALAELRLLQLKARVFEEELKGGKKADEPAWTDTDGYLDRLSKAFLSACTVNEDGKLQIDSRDVETAEGRGELPPFFDYIAYFYSEEFKAYREKRFC